jgi:hypothetical protein
MIKGINKGLRLHAQSTRTQSIISATDQHTCLLPKPHYYSNSRATCHFRLRSHINSVINLIEGCILVNKVKHWRPASETAAAVDDITCFKLVLPRKLYKTRKVLRIQT